MIANRLTTWENLVESTRPSGQFSVNPKELLLLQNLNTTINHFKKKKKSHKKKKSKTEYGDVSAFRYIHSENKIFISDIN